MKPLRYFFTREQLEDLASRSNFRYGKSIAEEAELEVLKSNAFNLEVEIKGGNHKGRIVSFESTPKGLRWKCSCSSKKNFFCEHCVAVGLSQVTGYR